MTDKELSELWCSIPTIGHIDADVIAFGHAVAARALLSASIADTAGAIPEGWKLVPTAPTAEMIVAIENQIDSQLTASGMDPRHMFRQDGEYVYEAMLAATPASSGDTAGAKPVAQVDEGDEGLFVEILYGPNGSNLKRGDKLYAAPRAPSVADAAGAFEKALRETYGMVDALNPPPAGSYYRGQHEGIIAALKTIRENFERIAATPASSSDTAGAKPIYQQCLDPIGGKWVDVSLETYKVIGCNSRRVLYESAATPASSVADTAGASEGQAELAKKLTKAYEDGCNSHRSEIAALRERIAGMEKAIKPFADAFESVHENSYKDADEKFAAFLDRNTITPSMTVGDFRRLRDAAIAKEPK